MIFQRITKLRELIKLNNLDGYIIPKNDQYFSEFAFPNRLKNISGLVPPISSPAMIVLIFISFLSL